MTPGLARWRDDWRVKTLVPVILINVIAFGALYALMMHFALSNLVAKERSGATIILNQLDFDFREETLAHHGPAFESKLSRFVAVHHLSKMRIFSPSGAIRGGQRTAASPFEVGEAKRALASRSYRTRWALDDNIAYFTRGVDTGPACQQCHPETPHVGALQVQVDLGREIAAVRQRVMSRFVIAGLAWIALLALMFWAGGVVIGRPLAQIEKSLNSAVGGDHSKKYDLDDLANRMHGTLWELIEAQRRREQSIAPQLARAEQLAGLGELAAGLTHEIRNPLSGVIAALELLRDDGHVLADNREIVDQMIRDLRRACTTVESLLHLARPQPPHRTDTDLTAIVRELGSLFEARFKRAGIALRMNMPESVPLLPLDPGLMSQLIVNLLTNSMQATHRGGSVEVLVAPFPKDDGVALAVSDNGRGIPKEQLDHVFDPFFTTREEGTGLGLAICRQIVTQHGGTIDVESEPGAGTRVLVLLPHPDSRPAEAAKETV